MMNFIERLPVASAVVCGIFASAIFERVPDHGISLFVCMALVTIISLVFGTRLPIFVRTLFTVLIFYFGSTIALVGRTGEPGLTPYTAGMALEFFALFAIWPALSLFRIWSGRMRTALVLLVLPISLALAFSAAAVEEYIFVQKHRASGIGPTPRWTVSNHWLAYDSQAGKLYGSD